MAVFKSRAIFGFEKLSQAKKLGSAPLFNAVKAFGADFLPRAQAGFASSSKERPV
jgi:hypothetical protein